MTDAVEYTIVLEEAEDGGWSALAPDLPGLLIAGDTREELLASAPDALASVLDRPQRRSAQPRRDLTDRAPGQTQNLRRQLGLLGL